MALHPDLSIYGELIKALDDPARNIQYNAKYDAYYDAETGMWMEPTCGMKGCAYCENRPNLAFDQT